MEYDENKQILSRLNDWLEARDQLSQMRSEYTGYSPSYHLHSWIDAEEKARNAFYDALGTFIDMRVKALKEVL